MGNKFRSLNNDELYEINGGGIAIAIFVAGAIISFGIGMYNGYKETERSDK